MSLPVMINNKQYNLPDVINTKRNILLQENKGYTKPPNVIFVTEIVSYYYPYEFRINEQQKIRGLLYHNAIQNMLKEECTSEVPIEKSIDNWLIKGRIDLLCNDWIVEIKGGRSSLNQGRLQLQIYDWMMPTSHKLLLLYSDLTFDLVQNDPNIENKVLRFLKARIF
jgi:hypothetical protein